MIPESDKYEDKIPKIFFVVFGVALIVACISRMPWHLHMSCGNSTTQLLSLNEDTERLQASIYKHEVRGEIDEACEDYQALLKAPGFKDYPQHYQHKFQNIAERREFAKDNTYLNEMICYEDVVRWRADRMPLRVYVPTNDKPDGFTENDRKLIDEAFSAWTSQCPQISYKFVDNEKTADIRFSQKHVRKEMGNSSPSTLAHCVPVKEGPSRWNVGTIASANIDVAPCDPDRARETDSGRRGVFIHEIGHALGLHHSSRSSDIMYFMKHDRAPALPSARDTATLKQIYVSADLLKDAELIVRQQAKRGNKNSLFDLAIQTELAGADTPAQQKEVFTLMKSAADRGHIGAQVYLGQMYQSGRGVSKDTGKSVECFTKAAEQGSGEAFLLLSRLLEKGVQIPKNIDRAEYCHRQAIRYGAARGESSYADFLCYQYGDPQSFARAIELYKSAAVGLEPEAMGRLSRIYKLGWAVKKDLSLSNLWFNKALYLAKSIKPSSAEALVGRSAFWEAVDRPHAALADLDAAEKMNPDALGLHYRRASLLLLVGEPERACESFKKASRKSPDKEDAYWRQVCNMAEAKWSESLGDFESLHKDCPTSSSLPYAMIYAVLSCRLAHDPREQTILKQLTQLIGTRWWPAPLVSFMKHEISAEALRNRAAGDGQGAEAHFAIALDLWAQGKLDESKKHWQWVLDNGDRRFNEYFMAQNLLKRLQEERKTAKGDKKEAPPE